MAFPPASSTIPLVAYRSSISLDEPAPVGVDENWRVTLRPMLAELGVTVPGDVASEDEVAAPHLIDALHGFLAPLPPGVLAPETVERIEAIAAAVNAERQVVPALGLPTVADEVVTSYPVADVVSMWVGDITQVRADAIVNAANGELLGCRLPHHPCIDNAIHSAAGPRLRDDCHAIIEQQGSLEPVGAAKITRGYALPAGYVLHTVGPQLVPGEAPTVEESELLASAYRSCLDVAARVDAIATVVFCGISTGVFAFPKPEAARIALETVASWLNANPVRFERIVFDFFSEADADMYIEVLANW